MNLSLLVLIATLLGIPLLPLGMEGIHGAASQTLLTLHIGCICIAALIALQKLFVRLLSDPFSKVYAGIVLLFILAEGFLPITSRDALIHHMAVPKWWMEAGEIRNIPWHEWSYYPMQLNLGFLGLFLVGLENYAALYHALYLIIAAALIGQALTPLLSKRIVPLATLFILSLPLCVRLATEPIVDLGLLLYASLFLVLLGQKSSIKHFLFLGIAIGGALSCKYNGLLFAAASGIALLLTVRKREEALQLLKGISFLIAGALIVVSPWFIKNYAATGNPIYPLYQKIFGPALTTTSSPQRTLSPIEYRREVYGESLPEVIAAPITMILFGRDGDPKRFDGVLSPLFLLIAYSLLSIRTAPRLIQFSIIQLSMYLVVALFSTSWRARYLIPLLPAAVALTFYALEKFQNKISTGKSRSIFYTIATILIIGWSALYTVRLAQTSLLVPYLSGELTTDNYLSRRLREYPVTRAVNERLKKEDRVYLLGTSNQFYYYTPQVFSGGYNSERPLVSWLSTLSTTASIAERMRELGITHILAHRERTFALLSGALQQDQKLLFNSFEQEYLQEIYSDQEYTLWKRAPKTTPAVAEEHHD